MINFIIVIVSSHMKDTPFILYGTHMIIIMMLVIIITINIIMIIIIVLIMHSLIEKMHTNLLMIRLLLELLPSLSLSLSRPLTMAEDGLRWNSFSFSSGAL
jgi:hypothetical protein